MDTHFYQRAVEKLFHTYRVKNIWRGKKNCKLESGVRLRGGGGWTRPTHTITISKGGEEDLRGSDHPWPSWSSPGRRESNCSSLAPIMNVIPVKELGLISTLVVSLPAVFERQGNPNDMNFILSHLKQAVCHRGITSSAQNLLVHLLIPLSRFKGGLMDLEELERKVVQEIPSSLNIQLQAATQKVRRGQSCINMPGV